MFLPAILCFFTNVHPMAPLKFWEFGDKFCLLITCGSAAELIKCLNGPGIPSSAFVGSNLGSRHHSRTTRPLIWSRMLYRYALREGRKWQATIVKWHNMIGSSVVTLEKL
ncbi:hypothetical protein QC761_0059570 [Podospora bellae-mahoneyi]|uniref:Uncharacterized protein n=1 Tax=Podospora bellae-mahoneyi TaxID=2093777 RepID=A0ABR0FQC8_9PEZI|nr:hypothetical protein QC761_0059570 [Podospora bellae-mahoneyi]